MTLGPPVAWRCAKRACDVRSVAKHSLPKVRTKAHGRPGGGRSQGTWGSNPGGFGQKCLCVYEVFKPEETLDLALAPLPGFAWVPLPAGATPSARLDVSGARGGVIASTCDRTLFRASQRVKDSSGVAPAGRGTRPLGGRGARVKSSVSPQRRGAPHALPTTKHF